MKDRVSLFATILLIILVAALIVITLENKSESFMRDQQIKNLTTTVNKQGQQLSNIKTIKGIDGRTPVKGVDYFDGAKGDTGATGAQGQKGDRGSDGKAGATGEKGEKGDPAPELDIKCVAGVIMKQYSGDFLWQPTNIKCESTNE